MTPKRPSRVAWTTGLGSPRDSAVEARPGLAPASMGRITCCQAGACAPNERSAS